MPPHLSTRRHHHWWFNLFALSLMLSGVILPLPNYATLLHAQIDDLGPALSTIQRIRNRGNRMIVGVAYDYAPFSALDSGGNVVGFEPELVRALADLWHIQVTFVPVVPTTRLQSLLAGQVDLIAAALPHTAANEAIVDFSTHYYTDTNALLLPVVSQALNFGELSGLTVATVQDDGALPQLDAYLHTTDATVTLLPFQEHGAALRALTAGQADALLGNYTYLTGVAARQSDLSVIVPLPGAQAFGFGMAPGDSSFRKLIDATLQQLYTTGRYAELYNEWFPTQAVPALPQLPGHWPYTIDDLPVTEERHGQSLVAQLRTRGILRVGVRYDMPPFGFLAADGSIQGFEVDLIREFAQRWFDNRNAVVLVRVTPDTAIPLLNAEQIDLLAAALADTWSSAALIDFSLPYYADNVALLVPHDSAVQTFADLNGKTLATVDGVDARIQIATLLDPMAQPLLMPFQEYRTAEQALLAGQIDGLVGSTTVLSQTAANERTLRLLPDTISKQSYAIGLPLFADDLRDLVNLTLQAMQLDGTYDAIYRKWFADPPFVVPVWPGIATDITNDLSLSLVSERVKDALILQPTLLSAPTTTVTHTIATVTPTATLPIHPATAIVSPTATPLLSVTVAPSETTSASILIPTSTPALPTEQALPFTTGPSTPEPGPLTVTTTVVATATTEIPAIHSSLPMSVTVLGNVNINVRTRPTTAAPILAVVSRGSTVTALLLSADGDWVAVALPGGLRGWVARRFLVEADELGDNQQGAEQFGARETATGASVPTPTVAALTPIATATPPVASTSTTQTNGATPAAAATATATTHRITTTDSLASIAQQYYGEQRLWTVIYEANRALIGDDPSIIPLGVELVIPATPSGR